MFAFLNADDTYRSGALRAAVEGLERHPDAGAVYGDADYVDEHGVAVAPYPVRDFDRERLMRECLVCQPAAFVRREAWSDCGGLNDRLDYALDYDLWIRLSKQWPMRRVPGTLATSRMHRDNKTLGQRGPAFREAIAVVKRHYGYVPIGWLEPYARHRLDGRDQFYDQTLPSRRSRALALLLAARHNPRQPRRSWRDWQAGDWTERFEDGWMSKVHVSTHAVPSDARRLVVAGRHEAQVRRPLVLTVHADGRRLGRIAVRRRGPFERSLDVPAEMCGVTSQVTVISAWTWRPGGPVGDQRRLSCLLDRLQFA